MKCEHLFNKSYGRIESFFAFFFGFDDHLTLLFLICVERGTESDGRTEHPSFLARPADLVRPVGSEALFECSTAGVPEPEVKW